MLHLLVELQVSSLKNSVRSYLNLKSLFPFFITVLAGLVSNLMFGVKKSIRKYVTGDESKRVRDHLKEKSRKPHNVKLIDKISFTLGVLNISICQYFLTNQPHSFWVWYSIILPILLISRMKHYRSKDMHYFLLDFCYFTVACTFLHLYAFPHSQKLFRVLFIYCNGPLTWAIVLWRNSFVFHDYDKIISVYIHILPSILTYTQKWYGSSGLELAAALNTQDYLIAALGYVFWQVCYFLKTEHLDKAKLDSNPHFLTSLRWLSKDDKNFAAKKVLLLCRATGLFQRHEKYDSASLKTKVVFMATQLVYTLITFVPTYFMYRNMAAHIAFIVFIMTASIFFGASYYIEVFSERYHLQFKDASSIRDFAQSTVAEAFDSVRQETQTTPRKGKPESEAIKDALALTMLSQMQDGTPSSPYSNGQD